jgi:hypothetical protein
MFGHEREEVAEGRRILHYQELHNLYASPGVTRVIKLRKMIRARRVARMGEMGNAFKILVGNPEGKCHSEDLGIDRRIIL